MNISVIIATLNRPEDLEPALKSIERQTLKPMEVIVVDQSEDDRTLRVCEEMQARQKEYGIPVRYLGQHEKSLVAARNRGLAAAEGEVICFLDDDVVLFDDFLSVAARYFIHQPDLAALSGNVLVYQKFTGWKGFLRRQLLKFFLLNDFKGGMTASGFGYPVFEREIENVMEVEMLQGCDMLFRKEAIGDELFDEWFSGYGYREDADFSYRISQKGKMIMVPDAKLYHHHSTNNRLDVATLKKMQLRNYYYVFKKYKAGHWYSSWLFAYSLMGVVIVDFFEFLMNRKPVKVQKLRKLSAGVRSSLELVLKGANSWHL